MRRLGHFTRSREVAKEAKASRLHVRPSRHLRNLGWDISPSGECARKGRNRVEQAHRALANTGDDRGADKTRPLRDLQQPRAYGDEASARGTQYWLA